MSSFSGHGYQHRGLNLLPSQVEGKGVLRRLKRGSQHALSPGLANGLQRITQSGVTPTF